MSNEQRAEQALRRFLANENVFASVLCQNYENHKKQGQLCLAPDGLGGWTVVQTDTHPLALYLPLLLNEEHYRQLKQGEKEVVRSILRPFAEHMLRAWSQIAFLVNTESNLFLNPGSINC